MGEDKSAATPTLYQWAGGRQAIEGLINAFYDRVEGDDLLSPLFPGGVSAEHRDHVTSWWCEVFGEPPRYTDELGRYERMLGKHRGLGITADQRFRFVSLMSVAADDAGLPADPEFRSALLAYLEWALVWLWRTPGPGRRSSSTPPCRVGGGVRPRLTSCSAPAGPHRHRQPRAG